MRKWVATFAALAVVTPAAALPADADAQRRPARARLATFDSCAQLVTFARRHAARSRGRVAVAPSIAAPVAPPLAPLPPPAPGREGEPEPQPVFLTSQAVAGTEAARDTSTTNVQEAGVDEPDIVKTDGRHVFVVASGRLLAVDARAPEPRIAGSLPLEGWSHELLVEGDRVLVISRAGGGDLPIGRPEPAIAQGVPSFRAVTRLTEVDASDPAALRLVRTQEVEGDYVTARQADRTARIVLAGRPEALEAPLTVAARRRAQAWLPQSRRASPRNGQRPAELVTRCDEVARPRSFSGLGTATILTVDLANGLPAVDADTVLSDAHTVYASTRRLYVATQQAVAPGGDPSVPPPPLSTAVHAFDTSDRGRTDYKASGTVGGTLLNQFSLSEHRGVLRTATTDWPLWWPGAPARQSESSVTTLAERGGRLERLGTVGGLGRGERIYAVRFVGDVGYVVTFRQTDPLYTVDLADPERPRVLGELKVLGYSAYLHPVGDDLVLGVGQDATEEGRRLGAQLSLFDVANLREPRRLAQLGLGQGSSSVEFDHRAFLHWPATRLAVVPVTSFSSEGGRSFSGAIGVRVGRQEGVAEVGRVTHDIPGRSFDASVQRSLVVGGRLFTVSGEGLEVGDLGTLAERAFVPFPPAGR